MVLARLQSLLGRIYDVEPPLDVASFLVTDPAVAAAWADARRPDTDEALFMRETDDGLELALFVDRAVLERLEAADPFVRLSEDNLQDCCTAVEGVSHLLYLAWSAMRGRAVSLLELETQAEVDKFAAALVLRGSSAGAEADQLHDRLFGQVRFAPGLDAERLGRYQAAHRFGARFCRRLARRWRDAASEAGQRGLFEELRRFYRLPHARKIALAAD
jgi:hypothetical protein